MDIYRYYDIKGIMKHELRIKISASILASQFVIRYIIPMLHAQIKEDIKDAMRARAEVRLSVLRGMLTAFTNELVATKRTPQDTLVDEQALAVIKRLANQRKDSIEQFEKGGRPELATKEREELAILQEFLPAQMSSEEIEKVVRAKIAELGDVDKSKSGQLVGAVMRELKGRADGAEVKSVVESILS
jgi:hypothetical protein